MLYVFPFITQGLYGHLQRHEWSGAPARNPCGLPRPARPSTRLVCVIHQRIINPNSIIHLPFNIRIFRPLTSTCTHTRKSTAMLQHHQEIIDRVIDYVQEVSDGHFHTPLRSCALVSKAWLPRSQRHLFHHVRLQYETELKRWCRNIMKERAKVLSAYARWLSYSPPYKTKDKNVLERFTYFTHIETLCVFKVDFGKFSDNKAQLQSAFGHFGNSPRYLIIDRCFGHFPTLINLFRLLPNLTHLDVLHTTLPYSCHVTADDMTGYFAKIETLRMAGTERYFINMLMPERFTVKNISYFDKGPESPGDLGLLLSNCKGTLETLTVLSGHNLTNLSKHSLSALTPWLYLPRIPKTLTCILSLVLRSLWLVRTS